MDGTEKTLLTLGGGQGWSYERPLGGKTALSQRVVA